MAALQNFVVFEGFLGREAPVVRQVTGGNNQPTTVSNFAICWSQSFWNKEKQQLESRNQTWVQVEAWGPVAEQISAASFAPGQQLQVIGRLVEGKGKNQAGETYKQLRILAAAVAPSLANPRKTIGQAMQQQQPPSAQQPMQQPVGWNQPAQPGQPGRPPF